MRRRKIGAIAEIRKKEGGVASSAPLEETLPFQVEEEVLTVGERLRRLVPELDQSQIDFLAGLPFDPTKGAVLVEIVNLFKTIGAAETFHFLSGAKTPADVFWNQPILVPVRALAMEEMELRTAEEEVVKGAEKCGRCGSDRVHSEAKQTRSLDEPTTIFYRCSACGKRWKN